LLVRVGALVPVVAAAEGVVLLVWGGGAEEVVVAAVFLSVVVCDGVVADDGDDESVLSCLKIFLSLSIVLGRACKWYDLGGVLAV
jgi:hypothetical protein